MSNDLGAQSTHYWNVDAGCKPGSNRRGCACPHVPSDRRFSPSRTPRGERDQQVQPLLILDLAHDDALQVSGATSLAQIFALRVCHAPTSGRVDL